METVRTHRVGSITTGLSLIAFGVMFVIHMFLNVLSYELSFNLWPVIPICLGVELLLSNFAKDKIVYDKAAIFLMFVMALFAMGMAGADWIFTHSPTGVWY